jgi:hypothetical protein
LEGATNCTEMAEALEDAIQSMEELINKMKGGGSAMFMVKPPCSLDELFYGGGCGGGWDGRGE